MVALLFVALFILAGWVWRERRRVAEVQHWEQRHRQAELDARHELSSLSMEHGRQLLLHEEPLQALAWLARAYAQGDR